MRAVRRFGWISLAAVALALLMPASTFAATPFRTSIVSQTCTYHGGAHGRGYVELVVKGKEIGMSGTNYMVFKSKLQASSGLAYSTQFKFKTEISNIFPDDASNYYHVDSHRWDFPRNFEIGARIVTTIQFWSSNDGLLYSRTIKGDGC
jgi:hypothetical protein